MVMACEKGEGKAALAVIIEILVLLTDAAAMGGSHPQATLPTFHQRPQQVPAGGGLIHPAGDFRIALQLQLRFLEELNRDTRGRFTLDPLARRPITAPGFGHGFRRGCPFPIFGQCGLAIVIPHHAGIHAIGEEVSYRRRVPDRAFPGGRRSVGLVEALGQLPTAQLLFDHGLLEVADHFGFLRVKDDLRYTAMPFGQIPIAITMIRPGHKLSPARFL